VVCRTSDSHILGFRLLLFPELPSLVNHSVLYNCLYFSRSCYSHLQLPTPIFFRSSSTDSNHLNSGFPTRRVPSGLSRVSFLQGSSSCTLQRCPSHLILTNFYHFHYVWFIVERIKLIIAISPYTIIVNRTLNHF